MAMKTLEEIAIQHGADKSSLLHYYIGLYDLLFRPFKSKSHLRLLELGAQFGNSLRTWREYFPNALIVGVDSVDNSPKGLVEGVTIIIGQAYEERMITDLIHLFFQFDIIIDDASHAPNDQAWFVEHYAPLLAGDGLLIVEDVPEKEVIKTLVSKLPEGWGHTAVDMTEADNPQYPSRLFIAWHK